MSSAMTCYDNTFAATNLPSTQETFEFKVEALKETDREEALSFLSARPVHTVCLSSFLRDNGVISPRNRGTFYGCRDEAGVLHGVALIGHATLVETQNDTILRAFADLKHQNPGGHLIRGEHDIISRFWNYYAELGHESRIERCEFLFIKNSIDEENERDPNLRPATLAELEEIKHVNANFIRDESGIDPTERDPNGFTSRLTRRIENNGVWILEKDGTIIFKADVFAQTPQAAYLEGIFVHPDYREQGVGLRCLRDLSNRLLQQSEAICLLVSEERASLEHFYKRAGYLLSGIYDTIYLA